MTTPSREEAPERIWVLMGQDHPRTFYWERPDPTSPVADRTTEYLRADLADREPSEVDVTAEREACAAIADSIANLPLIGLTHGVWDRAERTTALRIAKLIRARNQS